MNCAPHSTPFLGSVSCSICGIHYQPSARISSHILTAGRHLLKLINEVLDISRIESERLHLSLEAVSLSVALEETMDLIQPLATERSVNLFRPSKEDTNFFVLADHQRLKQVLLNLLSNGVKYTPAGGSVMISCKDLGGKVRLEVARYGHRHRSR